MKFRGDLFRPILALAACAIMLAAGPARGASMDAPRAAGMRDLGGGVFADPEIPAAEANGLKRLVEQARRRVAVFYGTVIARPKVTFCASADCYSDFGAVGLGFSNGANVVISPLGRRAAIVAHELAHVELSVRVGGLARVLDQVPQWFDEGQAVMVSMAPEFSDEAWQEATDSGRTAPALHELAAMDDWSRRTGANGEHMQLTYGTARREVARWFELAGADGLATLLAALQTREPFLQTYARIEAVARIPALAELRKVAATSAQDDGARPTTMVSPWGRAAW